MRSPEKVLLFIEELQGYTDEDIAEAVPVGISPPLLRSGLAMVAGRIPDDADDLDEWLNNLSEFCQRLRSDEVDAVEA